jgi:hypothetical protein
MFQSNSIKYLFKKKVVSELINRYSKKNENYKDRNIESQINKILEKFDQKRLKNNNLDSSFLGMIYSQEISYQKRKKLGEIYTPKNIVSYILRHIGYTSDANLNNKKVIDLSCGCGSFLEATCEEILLFYKRKFKKTSLKHFTTQEAEKILRQIEKGIFGIDINPIACILCQISLHLKLIDLYTILDTSVGEFRISHFNILHQNSYHISELTEYIDLESFDFVVGNPPYIFIRDIPEEHKNIIKLEDFITKKGQYDAYQLFIELGVRFLKEGGMLGYIIPDSLLALSNRRILRKYLYDCTKIRNISIIDSQFKNSIVSNIILIVEKEVNKEERERNTIKVKYSLKSPKMGNEFEQRYIKKWNYKFLINLNQIDIKILEHLDQKSTKIKDLMEDKDFTIFLNRGVELGKGGKIFYCEMCKKFYPFPRKKNICKTCGAPFKQDKVETIISDTIPRKKKDEYQPYLYSLNRYYISEYKYININKKGINYKELKNYQNRIIIRQMAQDNRICANYHEELLLCSQSYYNLKIEKTPIPQFSNYYLLGLINSSLFSYFFIKSFGSYKHLFPRILITNIKNLPIKIPTTNKEKELAEKIGEKVEIILNTHDSKSESYHNLQTQIDSIVFDLYQIKPLERKHIRNFILK